MKLLFDENVSPALVEHVEAEFPGATHVEHIGMRGAADTAIWEYAREHGFAIVSKDNDFRQRAFTAGPPPKVVWLSVGNAGTRRIADLLKSSVAGIKTFAEKQEEAVLVLEVTRADAR